MMTAKEALGISSRAKSLSAFEELTREEIGISLRIEKAIKGVAEEGQTSFGFYLPQGMSDKLWAYLLACGYSVSEDKDDSDFVIIDWGEE